MRKGAILTAPAAQSNPAVAATVAAAKKAAGAKLAKLVYIDYDDYIKLDWSEKAAAVVLPRVDVVGGGQKVLKLVRTDLPEYLGKECIPMTTFPSLRVCSKPEMMGNKDSPNNPKGIDTKLHLPVGVTDPQLLECLGGIMRAYERAAVTCRNELGFDIDLIADGVRRRARRCFGWTGPIPTNATKEEKDAIYISGEYPRAPGPNEYDGCLRLDIVPSNVRLPDPDKGERDAEIIAGFFDAVAAAEETPRDQPVTRGELTMGSRVTVKVALCGINMAEGGKAFQWWRVFEAFVQPGTPMARGAAGLSDKDRARLKAAVAIEAAAPAVEGAKAGATDNTAAEAFLQKVLDLIGELPEPNGVSSEKLAACLGAPLEEVRAALEALTSEMLIYCTTDMNHFSIVGEHQSDNKRARTE